LHTSGGDEVVEGNTQVADRLAEHLEILGNIPEELLDNVDVNEVRSTYVQYEHFVCVEIGRL
jgi:hypothetical protein